MLNRRNRAMTTTPNSPWLTRGMILRTALCLLGSLSLRWFLSATAWHHSLLAVWGQLATDILLVAYLWHSAVTIRQPGSPPGIVQGKQPESLTGQEEQIHLFRIAVEAAANAITIVGPDGVIKWVNPAFTELTGYEAHEAIGKTPRILKSGRHDAEFYKALWSTITSGRSWRSEMFNRRKDGTIFCSEMTVTPVRNEAGEVASFIAIQQDITERRRQEEKVRHLAMHDSLTNLPNRRVLQERLEGVARASRPDRPAALLLLDLDNFKLLNDTQGHTAGDHLLISLSHVLRETLNPDSLLCRLGGDEFSVLLEGVDVEQARQVADSLRRAVHAHQIHGHGYQFELGVSIGIAMLDGRLDAQAAMALADSALYSAKDQGKNRVEVMHPDDEEGVMLFAASHWAARIQDAVVNNRFVIDFQPVVRLRDQQPVYYEALIRLEDQEGRRIGPAILLSVAERFQMMPEIDRWMIGQVLTLLQNEPDLKLFVNLSGASLEAESILDFIEERVRATQLTPGRLIFEITELALVADTQQVSLWMERLHRIGIRFALKNFGGGISSYRHLRQLPIAFVKIDGSVVSTIDRDEVSKAIVRWVRDVAAVLDKQVIAEWVESEAIAQILEQLGIPLGQGIYLGEPGTFQRTES